MTICKKILLAAGWMYIALCQPILAQKTIPYSINEGNKPPIDTLIMYPGGNVQLWITGQPFKTMLTYSRADSVKELFLEDFNKTYGAQPTENYPMTAHYLVHPGGRRRLKAIADNYYEEPFNLTLEQRRLDLNAPAGHYILYDLAAGMQIHFLFENPEQISLLDGIPLTEAIGQLTNKDLNLRRSSRVELDWENNRWKSRKPVYTTSEIAEIRPNLGVGLIGSQWGCIGGGDISLILLDKYRIPGYSITFGLTEFVLTNFNEGQFGSIYFNTSADLRLGTNISRRTRPHWIGLQGGYFFGSHNNTELQGRFKFGIYSEGFTALQYGLDFIPLSGNRLIYSFALKFPF